jgi:hypothetical protein
VSQSHQNTSTPCQHNLTTCRIAGTQARRILPEKKNKCNLSASTTLTHDRRTKTNVNIHEYIVLLSKQLRLRLHAMRQENDQQPTTANHRWFVWNLMHHYYCDCDKCVKLSSQIDKFQTFCISNSAKMSDSDDEFLATDYLGRSTAAAASSNQRNNTSSRSVQNDSYSLDALLARREAIQRDAELAVGARRIGDDDHTATTTHKNNNNNNTDSNANTGATEEVDLAAALAAMRAAQAAAATRVRSAARLLTPQRVLALNAFTIDINLGTNANLGEFTYGNSSDEVEAGGRVVRLPLPSLAVPSSMKTNELITSNTILHLLQGPQHRCAPALLNALLLRVALDRVDVLLATRCAELACRIVRDDMCPDWRPSVADVLAMFHCAGARAVVLAPPVRVLRVHECCLGVDAEADAAASGVADAVLPVENVLLLCDVVALIARQPQLFEVAEGDESPVVLVRLLLTFLADARLGRVHDGAVFVLAALFDASVAAGLTDAVVRDVAGCTTDPATLYAVMRRLPMGSAGQRLVTSRAAALAMHALADGAVSDAAAAEARWRAADEAVRADGAASASGSLVRFAVEQFGRSTAVPLRTQEGETSECVADCNWLMTCVLLVDLCVSCDPNRLRGSARHLERWCEQLQARNTALHEDSFSPLLSLAKTQLGALRAKATMLAGVASQSAVRTIGEMMRQNSKATPDNSQQQTQGENSMDEDQ